MRLIVMVSLLELKEERDKAFSNGDMVEGSRGSEDDLVMLKTRTAGETQELAKILVSAAKLITSPHPPHCCCHFLMYSGILVFIWRRLK